MNGEVYEGHWAFDKPHGKGKLRLKDGSVFEGEYNNGEMNGYGVY